MVDPFWYLITMEAYELIFSISTYIAMTGWLMLFFLPRWKFTRLITLSGLVSLLVAGIYTVVVIMTLGDEGEGGFGSLAEVRLLFENPKALLAGWIHYLAFDLFIGAWEVANARKLGIPHGWIIPSLILTLLYGPIGLLVYFLTRAIYLRRISLQENF